MRICTYSQHTHVHTWPHKSTRIFISPLKIDTDVISDTCNIFLKNTEKINRCVNNYINTHTIHRLGTPIMLLIGSIGNEKLLHDLKCSYY